MKISYENSSGSLMIRLIGDVDDNGIIKARQDIDRLLEKERYYEVVFDFSGVSFMDSTGIGCFSDDIKNLKNYPCRCTLRAQTSKSTKYFLQAEYTK